MLQKITLSDNITLLCGDREVSCDTLTKAEGFWGDLEWQDLEKPISPELVLTNTCYVFLLIVIFKGGLVSPALLEVGFS